VALLLAGSGGIANLRYVMAVCLSVKTTLLIAGAITLTMAGCGSTTAPTSAAKASPSKTACDPADDSCIPPDHPTSSAVAVPAAVVGRPLQVQLPSDGGTVQAEVTVTGMPVKARTPTDKAGTREFCFGFKVKNTGTGSFGNAGFDWTWFGLDGEQVDDVNAGTADICRELGHQFAGLDQPSPLPGKFTSGYYSILIPAKPGAMEITDTDGTPLFRLNYGPKSAQVPIDARGQ
jgi:hypothetical protein